MIAVLLSIVVAQASTPPPSLTAIWAAEIRSAPANTFSAYCESPDAAVRERAALALGRLRDPEALPLLEELVQDENLQVRAAAGFSLGQTPASRDTILRRLSVEREPLPRERLVAALGFHAQDEDISLFLTLLKESPALARDAAIGLGRLKNSIHLRSQPLCRLL